MHLHSIQVACYRYLQTLNVADQETTLVHTPNKRKGQWIAIDTSERFLSFFVHCTGSNIISFFEEGNLTSAYCHWWHLPLSAQNIFCCHLKHFFMFVSVKTTYVLVVLNYICCIQVPFHTHKCEQPCLTSVVPTFSLTLSLNWKTYWYWTCLCR